MVNKCYEKKEKLQKAREKYQILSVEEKEEKCQYHLDQTKNLSEEEKQKNVKYMINYCLAPKRKMLGFYKVVWKLRIPQKKLNA